MNPHFRNLARIQEDAERAFDIAKRTLEIERSRCQHNWDDPKGKYDPIRTPGYQIPGDPPGTMGIDWRGPSWVEPTETPRWVRTCLTCGLRQETKNSTEKVTTTRIPDFR